MTEPLCYCTPNACCKWCHLGLVSDYEHEKERVAKIETIMWDLALCLAGWQTGASRNDEWINRCLGPANDWMRAKK